MYIAIIIRLLAVESFCNANFDKIITSDLVRQFTHLTRHIFYAITVYKFQRRVALAANRRPSVTRFTRLISDRPSRSRYFMRLNENRQRDGDANK